MKNLIIIIGADRIGNYETFAPIVNELKHTCDYEILTIFQSKELLRKISRNCVLSNVFLKEHVIYISDGSLSLFHKTKNLFKFLFLVLSHKNVALLTNKSFRSIISKVFILFLKAIKVKTYYTKSFCRAPTRNLRSLLGGKFRVQDHKFLCNFALIPTLEHSIEYGVSGYKLNQFIVTDYPKFYPSWVQLVKKVSCDKKIMKSDALFVFTKFYDDLHKVIQDVVNVMLAIDEINRIVLKPHPSTPVSLIQNVIDEINITSKKSVLISEENVMLLSCNTEVVVSYATSASYDARVSGKYLINYYDAQKGVIDKYRNSVLSDIPNFELFESSVLSDFLSNCICYEKKHLKESLLEHFSNNEKRTFFKKEISSDSSNLVANFL